MRSARQPLDFAHVVFVKEARYSQRIQLVFHYVQNGVEQIVLFGPGSIGNAPQTNNTHPGMPRGQTLWRLGLVMLRCPEARTFWRLGLLPPEDLVAE
jgi:hypothetical protein